MTLVAVDWDEGRHRWRDVTSRPYAGEKRATYTYAAAEVTCDYHESGPTFTGSLVARNLKPNFAYQIKLNGKPGEDDQANERLGYTGRWWAKQIRKTDGAIVTEWRSKDGEYDHWKARGFSDDEHDYVFEGYLLFDFILTDAAGSASKSLRLDSSYHVLWKTSQREPSAGDSAPVVHAVVAPSASDWYGEGCPDEDVAIYAEWEPGRASPGQLALPPGRYDVALVLTEESFHEREPDSGSWATVMADQSVVFTIPATT
jgi:hypothetical protein